MPFYWQANEPEPGKYRFAKDSPYMYRRPPIDMCLEFCEANGIEPKAHCLNYMTPGEFPKWWKKSDVKHEKELLEKRFRILAERYAERIPMWSAGHTKWRQLPTAAPSSASFMSDEKIRAR